MAEIQLSKGYVALVDDADFEWLDQWNWHVHTTKRFRNRYAIRNAVVNGRTTTLKMHRIIIGALPGQSVDHIDGNGLNNRRSNLRIATAQGNSANVSKSRTYAGKPCASRFKGVFRSGCKSKPWTVRLVFNRRQLYFGIFATEEEAASAYDQAAIAHFGEFARLNFPPPQPDKA